MLTQTIPSYLYQEYADDENLRAFVANYNVMAQDYVTWFATASLPIYTLQSDALLDWVAAGLYGWQRPTLLDEPATDDVFKRCITWSFYKGDGRVFNIRWLKRRLQRWLNGVDGTDIGYISGGVDQTYQISVTFGPPNIVYINILSGEAVMLGGPFDTDPFDTQEFDGMTLDIHHHSDITLEATLREAINSGILELPFQYVYVVGINP